MKELVDITLLRDIIERYNVSNSIGLRRMVRYLIGSQGPFFSLKRYYSAVKSEGIAISKDIVRQLLFYLEDCFLVRTVWIESASERRRQVNPRKAYPIDPGLIPIFDRSGGRFLDFALETVVFWELVRRDATITYVRTEEGYLVDFLARYPDGTSQLVQVSTDISSSARLIKKSRALLAAGTQFPVAEMILLTLYRQEPPPTMTKKIRILPAYEWILQGSKPLENK